MAETVFDEDAITRRKHALRLIRFDHDFCVMRSGALIQIGAKFFHFRLIRNSSTACEATSLSNRDQVAYSAHMAALHARLTVMFVIEHCENQVVRFGYAYSR